MGDRGGGFGVVVVEVFLERLPVGYAGYTDGGNIFLDDRLDAAQMLCTLVHEMIHIEMGHEGHQPEAVEMEVRNETARRLLPLDRIAGVCKSGSLADTAKKLGVTRQVLMDRAATLCDRDASEAGCWECQKCPAIQFRAARMLQAS
jgi:hypothetical protein